MPEQLPPPDRSPSDLAFLALRYANDDLDPTATLQFEDRLSYDQSARDALCLAVQLNHAAWPQARLRPDGAYRKEVRRRLHRNTTGWRRLMGRREYHGHPALWALIGAAAASLLIFGVSLRLGTVLDARPGATIARQGTSEEPAAASTHDLARRWSELTTTEHIVRAHAEETRRKVRTEERSRGFGSDNRSRHYGFPTLRP